ncbi:MAG: DUF2080 family transposase-associated protein [Nanoarchaeota archaeon]
MQKTNNKNSENNHHLKIEINLNKLEKGMKMVEEVMKNFKFPEDVFEKEIQPFSNSSHIVLPKKYAKKTAIIIIKK